MPDRLVVDLSADGHAVVLSWPTGGGLPEEVSRAPLVWPLDGGALEDLGWYLEDYLLAPFGVWEDRGPAVRGKLAGWGEQVFGSVFGGGPARFAYERARDRGLEVVFRSADAGLLALPWELMRDGAGPVALGAGGVSRSLPVAGGTPMLGVPGGRLRVLMVISRPMGIEDVGYQMVARPLMERLDAVRGEVDLTVLRPPTFEALSQAVKRAAEAGEPFHVVHFDGHGEMPGRPQGGRMVGSRPATMAGTSEGVLAFERPGGGSDHVGASRVAAVLAGARVPVVVLNACQSGALGKELEASVATALLGSGCAAVVAMAYSVYAVAAAEFMAEFYEALFTGDSLGQAVTAGRKRLFAHDGRPSPKGDMPLADWLVPVHYMRAEVRFPQVRAERPAAAQPLDAALDEIRVATASPEAALDPLAAAGGVFVGRDDLFYELEAAALQQRVAVLTGPGGTGKTELAKAFARWWRDTGGVDDPRLTLWHSFEPGVASFGLDGVISGIGLQVLGTDFARLDQSQRLKAVKRLMEQHRVLLIWDNFESVKEMPDPAGATPLMDAAGCIALKGFLDWARDHSQSAVIITSRAEEAWLGQVRRIEVGGLNRAEAARYAGHLLAPFPAARERQERRSFGELLKWLDGHPLAMRLTLPRLDDTYPADLLAGLRGAAPSPGADDLSTDRATSLPASIAYSYAHLSEETRQLLPAVSLFHGVADDLILLCLSSAETAPSWPGGNSSYRFAGVTAQEWIAVLEDATRVGLLTDLGDGMYRIHPALPGYLAAGWRAEDPDCYGPERETCEKALCTACAAFSVGLIQEIGSGDAARAYTVISLHRRTLGAMLGYALDHRDWDNADLIYMALNDYWRTRGLDEEAAAWTDRILEAVSGPGRTVPEPARQLWLQANISHASGRLTSGHLDDAEQSYAHLLAYLRHRPQTKSTRGDIGVIYHQLGMIAKDRGRLKEAENWYRKAIPIRRKLRMRGRLASDYQQLAIIAHKRGRPDEAENWCRKALIIVEELGDRRGAAACRHELAIIADYRGNLDEAQNQYHKALTIFEELGDRPRTAASYHQLGNAAHARGQLDEAEDWYRKALTIWEELGDRLHAAGTYHQVAIISHDRVRPHEAEDWCRKALAIFEEFGDHPHAALTCALLGLLAENQDQAVLALEWHIRSVALFDQFPSPLTHIGPEALARLTRQLGLPALETAWEQITGHTLPQAARDRITSHFNNDPPEGTNNRPSRRSGPFRRNPRP